MQLVHVLAYFELQVWHSPATQLNRAGEVQTVDGLQRPAEGVPDWQLLQSLSRGPLQDLQEGWQALQTESVPAYSVDWQAA